MGTEICQAVYRAKPGKADELAALIAGHVPLLQAEGLATDRAPIVMRSKTDGTFIEVFEWNAAGSAGQAHENPRVAEIWNAMGEIADFLTLADVPEATARFAHFNSA